MIKKIKKWLEENIDNKSKIIKIWIVFSCVLLIIIGKLVSALPPKHEEFYYQEEIEKIVYNTMKKALDIINTAEFEKFSMYITMNKLKEVMGSIRPYCNVCKEAKYATYLYNMCRSTLIFCQVAADDKDLLKKREQALHEDLLILRGFIKCTLL